MGDSMHKREENSVRVTNLSEDTREDDLRVCFPLQYAFLPYPHNASNCRHPAGSGSTSLC